MSMVPEGVPGLAIDWARHAIGRHAEGRGCGECRDAWCPTAEWALWVLVSDQQVRTVDRRSVTVVARQVVLTHWPRTVDGCRPCGLPDCERIRLAGAWLTAVGDDVMPTG
ncbi:hypothetical protein [Plantactinospora sp. CA-290183]|uniref:hypothetical protein n=1 Tax=Plantactinospora sp. CA-290183 TaxID=3240006 RepID=UPI003D8B0B28